MIGAGPATGDSALAPVMKQLFERAVDAGHGERMLSELLSPDIERH